MGAPKGKPHRKFTQEEKLAYPIALVYYIVKAKHENQTTPN